MRMARILLETRNLLLRQGDEADWESLYRHLWRHEEAFRFLFSRPSLDEEAARKRTAAYAAMHREVPTEYFVCERESGAVIGIAGVKTMSPGLCTITDVAIGPAYWGRGYGRQIVKALAEYAFAHLQAEKVLYSCFEDNEVSRRLALSCGFAYAHTEKAELQKNGVDVQLAVYQLKRK